MPYRVDISHPPHNALEVLVHLGALDVESINDGLAAIVPDGVTPHSVAAALGIASVGVSPATGRDNGSVWLLRSQIIRIGSLVIAPANDDSSTGALRLTDSAAFGTGHHPTTALCIEAIEEAVGLEKPDSILDIGTGSGVLALAALVMGVPRAVGLDIDQEALAIASENARLNNLADRLDLLHGGADAIDGLWPLVVANILAAPLIEMAPVIIRRVGRRGRLVLSGIPWAVEAEVLQAYLRLGMRRLRSETRGGWSLIVLQASW